MNDVAQVCRVLFANGTSFVRTQLRGNAATSGHFFVDFLLHRRGGRVAGRPHAAAPRRGAAAAPADGQRSGMNGQSELANIYHPYATGLRAMAALPTANSQILPTGGTTVDDGRRAAAPRRHAERDAPRRRRRVRRHPAHRRQRRHRRPRLPRPHVRRREPAARLREPRGARRSWSICGRWPRRRSATRPPRSPRSTSAPSPRRRRSTPGRATRSSVARLMRGLQAGTGGVLTPIYGQSWIESFAVPLAASTLQAGPMNIVSLPARVRPDDVHPSGSATGTVNGACLHRRAARGHAANLSRSGAGLEVTG